VWGGFVDFPLYILFYVLTLVGFRRSRYKTVKVSLREVIMLVGKAYG
jgi:hypothetical protein